MGYEVSDNGKETGRLFLATALVGVLTGLVIAAFHALLDGAERGRDLLRTALVDAPLPGWVVLAALGALILMMSVWLVRRFAPETAGSGIPEVETTLAGVTDIRWQRVLPIKFIAGTLALGTGAALGPEGPSIHLGAALGKMSAVWTRLRIAQERTLIAAGAAAGLAAIINAPLAAIVFVTEELREHFEYGYAPIQSVILACVLAAVVSGWALGQGPALPVPHLGMVPLAALPLFVVLGLLIGTLGVFFNRLILAAGRVLRLLRERHAYPTAGAIGLILGAVLWWTPAALGDGVDLIESLLHSPLALLPLFLLLALRLLTTAGTLGLGLPGGVLVPLLALGTIVGAAFDRLTIILPPGFDLAPGVFAVAAMGAFLAATIRAPLTGILMVIEMTGTLDLALPIIITCLTATFTAEGLGGQPLYSQLLAQSEHPPTPMQRPALRVALAGVLLAALIVIDQLPAVRDWDHAQAPAATPAIPALLIEEPKDQSPPNLTQANATSSQPPAPMPAADTPPPSSTPVITARGHYSIQLISFRDRASLTPFALRHGILDQAFTLATGAEGERWHPVLIGEYATRAEAETALAHLPAYLASLSPFLRPLPPGQRLIPVSIPRGETGNESTP
jgi:H+/Cl- antiporter ClcA